MMKLVSSRERYRCGLFWVTEERAVDPDGFEIRRSVVQHRGSAVMMAVDDEGRVLLVRQYRLPARAMLWEFPAGQCRSGRRALCKPRAASWKKRPAIEPVSGRSFFLIYASPGFVAEKMNVYLATGLTKGKPKPMDDERIRCRWFTVSELDRMIRSGRICDGKTIAGFLTWQR